MQLGRNAQASVLYRKADLVRTFHAGRHAHLTLQGELQGIGDKVAQDLRQLLVIGVELGQARGLFKDEVHRRGVDDRAEHPAQCREQVEHVKPGRRDGDAPGLDLGQVQQVVHHLAQLARRAADEAYLGLLLGAQGAVEFIGKQAGDAQDRAQGRAEFMTHVRQEAAFQV